MTPPEAFDGSIRGDAITLEVRKRGLYPLTVADLGLMDAVWWGVGGTIASGLSASVALQSGVGVFGPLGVLAACTALLLAGWPFMHDGYPDRTLVKVDALAVEVGEDRILLTDLKRVARDEDVIRFDHGIHTTQISCSGSPADVIDWLVERIEERRRHREGTAEDVPDALAAFARARNARRADPTGR